MNAINAQANDRRDIEDLLPWHAAGTLSRRDADRVERALAADQELKRRFELVREELGEDIHLNESLGAPSSKAMDRLFAMIDAEPARKPAASLRIGGRISELFASFSPRAMAYAGAAAAAIILAQAGVIGSVVMEKQNFGTASYGGATKEDGAYALVRFTPTANAEQITKALRDANVAIVEGPNKATGMYRVRIAVTGLPKDEVARVVKQLQDDKAVVGSIFQEPLSK